MSQDPHDLVAAYALDALDDEERKRFELHLGECEDCTEQLALLQQPVEALAYAAEGPQPSSSLRERILDAAKKEPRAAVIRFPRRTWGLTAVAGVAAVAAVAAIGLGLWANSLSNSLDRERAAVSRTQNAQRLDAAAISAILDSDSIHTRLSGLSDNGVLSVGGVYRSGVLVICDPLNAPQGKTFEAWVIHRGTPRPAGLFTAAQGKCVVLPLKRLVPKGATVAVTLERAGGVDKPTSPILYKATAA